MSNNRKVKFLNTLVWIIENFPSCPQEYQMSLDSPLFLRDGEIQIKLYPRGASSDCREFISCFLEMTNIGDVGPECKIEITDGEGSSLVVREFYVKPRDQMVEVGFRKFIRIKQVLDKIAQSNSDKLIIKCYLKKTQSNTNPSAELVARTLIGFERCFFTWFIENLDSEFSEKKVIYFPKLSKMEFCLRIFENQVEITVLKGDHNSTCDHNDLSDSDDEEFDRDDDELNRDGDYGTKFKRSLVLKISFLTSKGVKLMANQSWLDSNHEYWCAFKKDSLKYLCSKGETVSLVCETTVSYGTYLKHINPKESSITK